MDGWDSENARYYNNVENKDVQWLWYPYIPFGKLSLIQGDPGEGKTSLALKLASILSTGEILPSGAGIGKPQKVIYQAVEDSPSDTIKPRLTRYGADCRQIAFIEEAGDFRLHIDEDYLSEAIDSIGAKMLVLDPIQAFIAHGSDPSNVRQKMTTLSKVAEKTGCAIIMIGHMNKNEGGKDLYRGLGSIDVVAAARSVITVSRVEEGSSARLIRHIKSSLATNGEEFGFEITDTGDIEWIGPIEKDSEDIASQAKIRGGVKYERAKNILKEWLRDRDLPFSEIMLRIKAEGISQRTVSDAKKDIGVRSIKTADGWMWHLDRAVEAEEE